MNLKEDFSVILQQKGKTPKHFEVNKRKLKRFSSFSSCKYHFILSSWLNDSLFFSAKNAVSFRNQNFKISLIKN